MKEGVLELVLEIRATQNKVNNLENALVDQHAKDMKVKDAIQDLRGELESF